MRFYGVFGIQLPKIKMNPATGLRRIPVTRNNYTNIKVKSEKNNEKLLKKILTFTVGTISYRRR